MDDSFEVESDGRLNMTTKPDQLIVQLEEVKEYLHASILRHFGAKLIKAHRDKVDQETMSLIYEETRMYTDTLNHHIKGLFSVFNEMNQEV